jgi:hypothetical protein
MNRPSPCQTTSEGTRLLLPSVSCHVLCRMVQYCGASAESHVASILFLDDIHRLHPEVVINSRSIHQLLLTASVTLSRLADNATRLTERWWLPSSMTTSSATTTCKPALLAATAESALWGAARSYAKVGGVRVSHLNMMEVGLSAAHPPHRSAQVNLLTLMDWNVCIPPLRYMQLVLHLTGRALHPPKDCKCALHDFYEGSQGPNALPTCVHDP